MYKSFMSNNIIQNIIVPQESTFWVQRGTWGCILLGKWQNIPPVIYGISPLFDGIVYGLLEYVVPNNGYIYIIYRHI